MGEPNKKIGNRSRGTVRDIGVRRESEDAVVVQRRLLGIVLTVRFAAEVQRVLPLRDADNIADRIHIASRNRTRNCVACCEPAGDPQLRTGAARFARCCADRAVRQLLGKGRSVLREALTGRRHTAADQASVVQHQLIDRVVVDRPGMRDVGLMLGELVVMHHPAENVVARRIHHKVARLVEVAERQSLFRRQLVIALVKLLVRLLANGLKSCRW